MDRKSFIQKAGRWSLMGGLAAVTGVILLKRSVTTDRCAVSEVCKGCNEYSFCSKDQALKQRIDERKQKG